MKENPYREDRDQIRELLKRYDNLRNGKTHSFIEEEAFEKIVDYFHEVDDLSKALEAAESGCEQYPYSSLLLIKKADILLSRRSYNEVLEILEKASLLDSNNINLYILKTDAYLAMDQQEKAVVLLEEALNLFEGEERRELLFELADVYDDYEEFDKVFDCLKMILEEDLNNEEALYKICFWTDFTGRNEESIRLHNKIINEFPYNELAWFNLAAAYQGLKLYEKSIDAYQYAIAIDEKFDYAYRNMGDAYIRLRKYKEAIEVLEKVNEMSKPEDVILEAIGYCYDRLKNFAQARFYYRKASHLRQEDGKLHFKIACTYFNEGQWTGCIRQLETALKINRNQADFHLLYGECKIKLGHYKEALQYFSNAVRIRPKNTSCWEAFTRCLILGDYADEAMEQLGIALKMTKENALFLFYRVAALLKLGKTKEATLQLQQAMEKSPRHLKKFIELDPGILRNQHVVDVLAKFKRRK
ncbi:MAG TPA: CDC27 family protein [Chitinophagaceae bacterium]|nr:CDC27 family protein [Chitinophagaceae bacterium]